MKKTIENLHLPNSTVLVKNLDAAHAYLKNTLSETKQDIKDGFSFFKEGISDIKEGISDKLHKTGACINTFALPVNNFIKDITQIENEFVQERAKNAEYCICLNGQMVPASEVANLPMEENY